MQGHFTQLDWLILAVYFAGTMAIGFYFWRRSRSTEGFTAAGRAMPGWLCGLSIFATYVSSISFLALPGKAFADNWNPFAFSLALPIATWVSVAWFLPYYRSSQEVSAYALLEHRFGPWARVYASVFYLLTQIARTGAVMYLMAMPLSVVIGKDIRLIILITGVSVTVYSFVGGIIAVIWTDALQAIVLMAGAAVCAVWMPLRMPDGPGQVFAIAAEHHKFSLGAFGPSLAEATFWVVLIYGLFTNLQNFGIDQSYVQRYIASSSDREARKSLWLGGLLYIPVSAVFFFIGTALFAYYTAHPDDLAEVRETVAAQQLANEGVARASPNYQARLASTLENLTNQEVGDKVFPHFIGKCLPPGVTGLLIAAILAAAMSTISTSLNSSATLLMSDYYKRFIRPNASERQSMLVLYASTIAWGALGAGAALLLVPLTESVLDIWWTLSSVFSGGILGLFLLGMISRAKNPAAVTSVLVGGLVILWMVISPNWGRLPGVVTVKQGSTEVVGLHTDFAKHVRAGDAVRIKGRDYVAESAAADGQGLTLAEPFDQSDAKKVPIFKPNQWTRLRSPFHAFLVIVIGTLAILLVGLLVSRLPRRQPRNAS
jgi:SSS family solute:Na+ symporter